MGDLDPVALSLRDGSCCCTTGGDGEEEDGAEKELSGKGRVLPAGFKCSPCSLPPLPESVMEPSSENMSKSLSQLPCERVCCTVHIHHKLNYNK